MLIACRALRKPFSSGVRSCLKTFNTRQGTGMGIDGYELHLGGSIVGSCLFSYMQKHAPYFLHRRQVAQDTLSLPQSNPSVFKAYQLRKCQTGDLIRDQLRLDNVHNHELVKMLKFMHLERVKRKLQAMPDTCISYKRLLEIICTQNFNEEEGRDIIKSLDRSGTILRIGQKMYIHPQQLVKVLESALPLGLDESCEQELQKLEKEKAIIDLESERLVRKELWCGLGLLSLHTAGLFRLTFWDFSWDIMEPICFFIGSAYCLLGYAFFMKTARDLTFESLFASRFRIKQRKVMKMRNFDIEKYRELQRRCRLRSA